MRMAMEWLCSSVTCSRCDNSFFWSVLSGILTFSFLTSLSLSVSLSVSCSLMLARSVSVLFPNLPLFSWSDLGLSYFFRFFFSLWLTSLFFLLLWVKIKTKVVKAGNQRKKEKKTEVLLFCAAVVHQHPSPSSSHSLSIYLLSPKIFQHVGRTSTTTTTTASTSNRWFWQAGKLQFPSLSSRPWSGGCKEPPSFLRRQLGAPVQQHREHGLRPNRRHGRPFGQFVW